MRRLEREAAAMGSSLASSAEASRALEESTASLRTELKREVERTAEANAALEALRSECDGMRRQLRALSQGIASAAEGGDDSMGLAILAKELAAAEKTVAALIASCELRQ